MSGNAAHCSHVSNTCNLISLIFFANLHVRRQFRLSRIMVPRKTAILGDAQSLEGIVQIDGNLQIKELEVDCPDCFDTMIKVYDLDKARYQCENCDLTIGEYGWL